MVVVAGLCPTAQVDDHIKQKEGEWERVHARLAEEHERAWAAEVTERRRAAG